MNRSEGEVSIEHKGKRFTATWKVERDLITVTPEDGHSRTAQLGDTPPHVLAKIMLSEYASGSK